MPCRAYKTNIKENYVMKMEFENKTAIITGGASGIGLLCGQNLAKMGANVLLVDINEDALKEKCAEINAENCGKAAYAVVDVRCYEQVVKAVDSAFEQFESVDYLINCAGGCERRCNKYEGGWLDTPSEIFDWGIDVNLKGPLYFSQAAMRYMVKQKSGVIIYLGSICGEEASRDAMAYSASKAALMHGLVKSMALFGAPHGVRAVCVSPGPVLTRPNMANLKTLMGRAAEPQEIVDFILYMVSDKAKFITGTNHFIDGGRIAMIRG